MFDGKRGLPLEVARLVSQERDYWDFDIIQSFVAATFGDQLHVDSQYFHPDAFGAEEFVERLKRSDSVGAVLQVRCMDLRRARPLYPSDAPAEKKRVHTGGRRCNDKKERNELIA